MAYSSKVDVRTALAPGAVGTDVNNAASLSDAQLDDAIAEADATIDAYLEQGYNVTMVGPVAIAPFRFWSRDIAAYLATLTFRNNKDVGVDDPIRLRYAHVMSQLQAVSTGKIVLPPDDSPDDEGDLTVWNQYEGQLFGPTQFDIFGNPVVPGPHPPFVTYRL